jgi:hypothetical protein
MRWKCQTLATFGVPKEMINRLIIQAHLKVLIALFRLGKP